ncbi:SDR family NAD(P)-dependent oxidoreductase [Acetobacteraceae bacterium]|nr:SDR family NAD(P)-dependent oxidoreductase [Acetobacteraceae bacterium]
MYHIPDQSGRRFVITGANSGTGKEATRRLAEAGAEIIMAVRNLTFGEIAKEDILRQFPRAKLEVRHIDLADLKTVESFSENLKSDGRGLDVLINNAAVMSPPKRYTTKDNFELQFGTNYLGPFALTNHLVPLLLKSSKSPRVTTMASCAAIIGFLLGMSDLQSEKLYLPFLAYARSKLADLHMANQLAKISAEKGWNLLSNAAHPGCTRTRLMITGPNMGTNKTTPSWVFKFIPAMNPDKGALPLIQAATDPNARPGSYYGPRWLLIGKNGRVKKPESYRWTDGEKLWKKAEKLTGVSFADELL